MSRTPGASCLQDVRTTAILQDYIITTNNCAPGVAAQLARRDKLGGIEALENCQPPACGFDRPRDLLSILGGMLIVATAIGVIHSFIVFFPNAIIEYDAGFLELSVIVALTYFVLLVTACMSHPVIEYAGHKLTALFGMILIFIGILIDSQVFHISVLYVSNIIFVGVGCGFSYAASMTLPSDLFRAKLTLTFVLINISGSIGSIFYTWLFAYVVHSVGYKWAKIMQAILILLFTLSVHAFPKTRFMYSSGCDRGTKGTAGGVRECIYQVAAAQGDAKKAKETGPKDCDDSDSPKNLLCVCVCDLRLYGDRSFILWAALFMVATMNFHVAYLTINSYAETVGAGMSYWYLTVYCLSSIGGRLAFIGSLDFTFEYNRNVFQGCVFASGVMWILINWAVTFGWILVACAILGAVEGVICVVTSRVALATIPRRWLAGAWVTCILCHAIGMFVTVVCTTVIAYRTVHYTVAYITSGIIQLIVSLLATLLPSEEEDVPPGPQSYNIKGISTTSQYSNRGGGGAAAYSSSFATGGCHTPLPQGQAYRCASSYVSSSYRGGRTCCEGLGGMTSARYLSRNTRNFPFCPPTKITSRPPPPVIRSTTTQYRCKCAICSRYGCIPNCLPECTPGGSLRHDCGNGGSPSTAIPRTPLHTTGRSMPT